VNRSAAGVRSKLMEAADSGTDNDVYDNDVYTVASHARSAMGSVRRMRCNGSDPE